ncbi:hypothetical protein ACJROX_26285 [Pseudalkalibacillus sp. A8]|uniref:hypothetical protein n=1 Tax=Pseudalkalibacillus sp. A8 TaxID=3382641 RepID=UPI0038B6A9AD
MGSNVIFIHKNNYNQKGCPYDNACIELFHTILKKEGKNNNNQLVFKTIQGAIIKENPIGTMIHSDRGFQYTSKTFGKMITGMIQSMSRVGRCLDNAYIESFFGALKQEKNHLNRSL